MTYVPYHLVPKLPDQMDSGIDCNKIIDCSLIKMDSGVDCNTIIPCKCGKYSIRTPIGYTVDLEDIGDTYEYVNFVTHVDGRHCMLSVPFQIFDDLSINIASGGGNRSRRYCKIQYSVALVSQDEMKIMANDFIRMEDYKDLDPVIVGLNDDETSQMVMTWLSFNMPYFSLHCNSELSLLPILSEQVKELVLSSSKYRSNKFWEETLICVIGQPGVVFGYDNFEQILNKIMRDQSTNKKLSKDEKKMQLLTSYFKYYSEVKSIAPTKLFQPSYSDTDCSYMIDLITACDIEGIEMKFSMEEVVTILTDPHNMYNFHPLREFLSKRIDELSCSDVRQGLIINNSYITKYLKTVMHSSTNNNKINESSCFVFPFSDVMVNGPGFGFTQEFEDEVINEIIGGYLYDLDMKKTYISGLVITAAMSFLSQYDTHDLQNFLHFYYPSTTTSLLSNSDELTQWGACTNKPGIALKNILQFVNEGLADITYRVDKTLLTLSIKCSDKCSTYTGYRDANYRTLADGKTFTYSLLIGGGEDVDMYINAKDDEEFVNIVKSHYDVIVKYWPNVELEFCVAGHWLIYSRSMVDCINGFRFIRLVRGTTTEIINQSLPILRAWRGMRKGIYATVDCIQSISGWKIGDEDFINTPPQTDKNIASNLIKYEFRGFEIETPHYLGLKKWLAIRTLEYSEKNFNVIAFLRRGNVKCVGVVPGNLTVRSPNDWVDRLDDEYLPTLFDESEPATPSVIVSDEPIIKIPGFNLYIACEHTKKMLKCYIYSNTNCHIATSNAYTSWVQYDMKDILNNSIVCKSCDNCMEELANDSTRRDTMMKIAKFQRRELPSCITHLSNGKCYDDCHVRSRVSLRDNLEVFLYGELQNILVPTNDFKLARGSELYSNAARHHMLIDYGSSSLETVSILKDLELLGEDAVKKFKDLRLQFR